MANQDYYSGNSELDFGDQSRNSLNNIADYELHLTQQDNRRSKSRKHDFKTKDRIYELQEARRLKKLTQHGYDEEWDN